jgi:hypothetical protein
MTSPLQAAGASPEPSEYAPISMDRAITGLWTQRSPLRDAAVPYLQAKFYSASRFDSLIDGLNREISAKLTTVRRPGLSVYNSAAWAKINSFFSFSWLVGNTESVQVIAEEADNPTRIYDATGPSTRQLLFTSAANAGFTRFASVNNALYFMNGTDAKKYLQPSKAYAGSTSFTIGDYIRDTNGNIQQVTGVTETANIASIQVLAILGVNYVRVALAADTAFSPGLGSTPTLLFAGLTTATFLNGQTLGNITTYADNVIQVQPFAHAAYGPAADTGTVTGLTFEPGESGTSASSAPTWNVTLGGTTTDGTLQWTNRGIGVYNLGVISPTIAPTVVPSTLGDNRFWQPSTTLSTIFYSILDQNGNIQILTTTGVTGSKVPMFNAAFAGFTFDGTVRWTNAGKPSGSWVPTTVFQNTAVILDSNGNFQLVTSVAGTSGGSVPTWNVTVGGTTTDGGLTWNNIGTGALLTTAGSGYAYAYQALDGSITNASPTTFIVGGVLGSAAGGYQVAVSGPGPGTDLQYSGIVIYRIEQGGSILLQLDIIPNTGASNWNYLDTLPDADLDAFLEAPIDNENNPPPVGATAPCEHLQRQFVAVGATAYYSTGPDTNSASNGYTAFNPSNFIRFKSAITRFDSVTLNTGPALIVWTTSYIGLITGNGTTSSPFTPSTFIPDVGLLNYSAASPIGSTFYLLDNHLKAVSIDPGAGYAEIGFPIGDQFLKTTTGGLNNQIFSPVNAFVTWYEGSSGDSGLYYADGQNGWFRYSPVSSPESGFLWSPIARIEVGTSAVQSVRVQTGQFPDRLLVGPPGASGPILMRDTTTNQDNGTPYSNCYLTMGNIELCQSGEVAEIAHIALDSIAIGARPTVGLLLGEIKATPQVPFDMLQVSSADPENLPQAQTLFNDRYVAMQNGVCPKCRHFQLLIQYPVQNVPDELLAHTIYGAKHSERKQQ